MIKSIRKYLFPLLIFISGIVIGSGIGFYGATSYLRFMTTNFLILDYSAFEADEANMKYLSTEDINTKISALEHYINYREKFTLNVDDTKTGRNAAYGMCFAYVRLGFLHEKKGNVNKATEYFQKGLDIANKYKVFIKWKGTDKEIRDINDLRNFVNKMDEQMKEQKQQ